MPAKNIYPTLKAPVIDLDECTRSTIISTVCAWMIQSGTPIDQAIRWRSNSGGLDYYELLDAAARVGIVLTRSGYEFNLPLEIITQRSQH
jgi:hypothetical protein